MKKILLATILTTALFASSMCVNAQTSHETEAEGIFVMDDSFIELMQTEPEMLYERYSNILSVQEVSLENSNIDECVEVYEYASDGSAQELDCEVTLNKILCRNDISAFAADEEEVSTFYVLTASSKISEDSLTENGVTLYGCIGWEDTLGPVNSFKYASGSRSGAYSGQGYYQALRGTATLCHGYFDSSFYATSEDEDTTGTQFRLIVRSSSTNGNTVQLNMTTSIFD